VRCPAKEGPLFERTPFEASGTMLPTSLLPFHRKRTQFGKSSVAPLCVKVIGLLPSFAAACAAGARLHDNSRAIVLQQRRKLLSSRPCFAINEHDQWAYPDTARQEDYAGLIMPLFQQIP
jgi:hypothetical protein